MSKNFVWSKEQHQIFDAVTNFDFKNSLPKVFTVNAVAGASKTTTMIEVARRLKEINPDININYLVFGSAASAEATESFKNTAKVSTLHKLAHDYTIKCTNMELSSHSFISWKDVSQLVEGSYNDINKAIALFNGFCESPYLTIQDYVDSLNEILKNQIWDEENYNIENIIESNAEKMLDYNVINLALEISEHIISGRLKCLHSHYLKVFHIMLHNNDITLPECDVLIVDECQDLSQITAEVVEKYPAKLKIFVGDKNQAIFGFLSTVNAFDIYTNAKKFTLSKSYRVSKHIAKKVQNFCRTTFAPDMVFKGIDYNKTDIKSIGYLTRTNSALLTKIIEFTKMRIPYQLSSRVKINQLFDLPLALIRASSYKEEKIPKFKFLNEQALEYKNNEEIKLKFPTLFSYLLHINSNNEALLKAIRIITTYGPYEIISVYNSIKSNIKNLNAIYLSTAHAAKGKTLDKVILDDDFNYYLDPIMDKLHVNKSYELNKQEIEELMLYYVACTRARYEIVNAKYL